MPRKCAAARLTSPAHVIGWLRAILAHADLGKAYLGEGPPEGDRHAHRRPEVFRTSCPTQNEAGSPSVGPDSLWLTPATGWAELSYRTCEPAAF